jgi:hypothetical protein
MAGFSVKTELALWKKVDRIMLKVINQGYDEQIASDKENAKFYK